MDWDKAADYYDHISLQDPIYVEALEKTVAEVADCAGSRVLDLGCGTGNLTSLLLQGCPDSTVVGVDPSGGMREKCINRFQDNPRISISMGDSLNIPFPDESFDIIMSSYALHHVPPYHSAACAAELARVLAPGGSFIHADTFCGVKGSPGDPAWYRDNIEKHFTAALYNLDHGAYESMFVYLSQLPNVLTQDGEYLITVDEWKDTLEAAGFTAFKVIDLPAVDLLKIVRCTLR